MITDHSEFTQIYAEIPFYMFSSILFTNAVPDCISTAVDDLCTSFEVGLIV
jgi:hypothetical protein